jgi:hypothetical protein
MSTYEYIFIATDLGPEEVAEQLSALLDLRVTHNADGEVVLGRPASEGLAGRVGGELGPNIYAYPSEDRDEPSALDGYALVWTIRYTNRNDDIQLAEARVLFSEVTKAATWPLLLLHGLDFVVAAWRADFGLREFPAGTTPEAKHRELWEPFRPGFRSS